MILCVTSWDMCQSFCVDGTRFFILVCYFLFFNLCASDFAPSTSLTLCKGLQPHHCVPGLPAKQSSLANPRKALLGKPPGSIINEAYLGTCLSSSKKKVRFGGLKRQ
ncbi:hypothetical protein OCU04_006347 [Sclerotinia nivalis]|uniref:Uncharacterized protein n=1 Tax=Sclerotinia nivalis TaxID=352851 RepID=A0A9X0AMV4_9HELO|nr:hypothetical protein OCU04_006347 [Sclerotinia nivalis]